MALQQYKQQVLNSNDKLKCQFLVEDCPSSESLDLFCFKSCSIVLELTYLAGQAICTHSPVDIIQLTPLCFLALYVPLTPFSVNTTYQLVPLKIIFKPKILQSSSMLNIYFISTFICIFHSYLTLKNKKNLLKTKILYKQETKTAIEHYKLIIKENEKYFKILGKKF